ncbi:MAG: hypothetical protein ACE5FN_04585 [Leptospirillia bacterium]
MQSNFRIVATFRQPAEAEAAIGLLQAAGIEVIRCNNSLFSRLLGFLNLGGNAGVAVPVSDHAHAEQLLRDLRIQRGCGSGCGTSGHTGDDLSDLAMAGYKAHKQGALDAVPEPVKTRRVTAPAALQATPSPDAAFDAVRADVVRTVSASLPNTDMKDILEHQGWLSYSELKALLDDPNGLSTQGRMVCELLISEANRRIGTG